MKNKLKNIYIEVHGSTEILKIDKIYQNYTPAKNPAVR